MRFEIAHNEYNKTTLWKIQCYFSNEMRCFNEMFYFIVNEMF